MKKWFWKLLLIYGIVAAHKSVAAVETLNWNQVVQQAREHNADILEQQQALKAAESTQSQSIANFFPSISASASGNRSETNNVQTDSVAAALNLRYNIFSGFSDLSRYSQAKERTLIARLGLQQTLANISAQLKESFSNLVYAKSLESLNQVIAKRRFENMRMVQLRYESGSENKGSYLQAKAYHEEAEYNLARAKMLIHVYKTELATFMGRDPSSDFDISGEIAVGTPLLEPSFEEVVREIPPVLQAEAQVRVAKYGVEIAQRSGFLPSVDISGNIGRTDNKFYPELNNLASVGVTLSIPLFDGFGDYHGVKAAMAQSLSQVHARDRILRAQLVSLRTLYMDYSLTYKRLQMTADFKEAAATRGKISRERYNNGLMTFENWDNVESENIQRERAYLEAKKDAVVVEARWEKALGRGVFNE